VLAVELVLGLAELLAVVWVAVALGCEAAVPPELALVPELALAFSFPDAALLALDVATA
jgi:hypothetical protein